MHRTHTHSSASSSSSINGTEPSDTSTTTSPRRSNSLDFPAHSTGKRSIVNTLIHPSAKSDPASGTPFLPSTIPPPEINDPALFRPDYGRATVNVVWRYCAIRGWLTKHTPPTYSFSKTRKMRYIVLADRMIYAFKTESPTPFYREFLELSADTNVFVTDRFPGVLYCIAVNKRSKTWYLQCEDAHTMKLWLDRLKRTLGWLRANRESSGIVTLQRLSEVPTEHDQLINNVTSSSSESVTSSLSSPTFSPTQKNTLRMSGSVDGEEEDNSDYSTQWNHHAPTTTTSPQQDLYYANEYDGWEPPRTSSLPPPPPPPHRYHPRSQRTLSSPHPSILPPPQRPPPTTAPPPPPPLLQQ